MYAVNFWVMHYYNIDMRSRVSIKAVASPSPVLALHAYAVDPNSMHLKVTCVKPLTMEGGREAAGPTRLQR